MSLPGVERVYTRESGRHLRLLVVNGGSEAVRIDRTECFVELNGFFVFQFKRDSHKINETTISREEKEIKRKFLIIDYLTLFLSFYVNSIYYITFIMSNG